MESGRDVFKILSSAVAATLILAACSKNDQQAVGARIPTPGSDHLTQVYVMFDRVDAGPLALDFLASSASAVPNGKLYVARPQVVAEAENELRTWSARTMDWLVISGPLARAAFLNAKISWSNTRHIVVIGEAVDPKLRQEIGAKVTWLLVSPKLRMEWADSYCAKTRSWPECGHDQKADIFAWSYVADLGASSLVNISWNWPSFLDAVVKDDTRDYRVSFKDGFLTLELRSPALKNDELAARLNGWIKDQALLGLSTK